MSLVSPYNDSSRTSTGTVSGKANRRSSGDGGSSGSGSSLAMSGPSKHRHKSPGTTRREREKGTSDGGTPHLPRMEPIYNQGSQEEGVTTHSGTDEDVDIFLPSSSFLSNGSSEHVMGGDDVDGHLNSSSDLHRTRAAIEHMQNKIGRTKEQIRDEQTTRDDNVNEYLKLAANADKQQLQRIKAVFEKKNQKSAQNISQLQKKLESYNKRLRELVTHGLTVSHHRQPREVLRDMGQGLKLRVIEQECVRHALWGHALWGLGAGGVINVGGNIRDGITGFSGTVMSKPREFAHLIKNKFGSADNINTMSRNGDGGSVEDEKAHHGSATLPGNCSLGGGGGSAHASSSAGAIKLASDEGSVCSSVTSGSVPHQVSPHHHNNNSQGNQHHEGYHLTSATFNLEPIFVELQDRREELERLREEMEGVKQQALQREVTFMNQTLQEERFRSERLEEQVNDLTELHQNEVENLKQNISDMEEKVQYQSEERLRDIHEMLECCQTKISKMEHQQQQHQQYVTLEGIDNSNARALVVKLINVVLTVLQVVLLLVATAAGIVMPFPSHSVSTVNLYHHALPSHSFAYPDDDATGSGDSVYSEAVARGEGCREPLDASPQGNALCQVAGKHFMTYTHVLFDWSSVYPSTDTRQTNQLSHQDLSFVVYRQDISSSRIKTGLESDALDQGRPTMPLLAAHEVSWGRCVPPGDVTSSLSCPGCILVSLIICPAPRTVWAASRYERSRGRPILTPPSANASTMI
uniref:Transmembrane and coiled-coil domains protein 1 n=1 Tax=Timema tahoe TaxID=61484 RepID=A0A7R9FL99_9NEOP|nr:unnamed protein product [Timema tahoe]